MPSLSLELQTLARESQAWGYLFYKRNLLSFIKISLL